MYSTIISKILLWVLFRPLMHIHVTYSLSWRSKWSSSSRFSSSTSLSFFTGRAWSTLWTDRANLSLGSSFTFKSRKTRVSLHMKMVTKISRHDTNKYQNFTEILFFVINLKWPTDIPFGPSDPVAPCGPGEPRGPGNPGAPAIPGAPCNKERNVNISE